MPTRRHDGARARRTGKLTPGHRLPREVVSASQRERLMVAMAESVDEQGFPATSVSELTVRAHVSRAAFYEHFQSLENCFLATYDAQATRAGALMLSAHNAPGLTGSQRVGAAMQALVDVACAWPAAARICVLDVLSAGPAAIARRERAFQACQALIDGSAGTGGSVGNTSGAASRTLAVALTGGLRRMLHVRLRERPARRLPGLAEDLASWLQIYLGRPAPPPAAPSGELRRTRGGARSTRLSAADPRRTPTPAELAQEQQRRIVDAVTALAAKHGYGAMTHPQIAATAKISYGTFYKHFESKGDALLAACDAMQETVMARVERARADAGDWPKSVCDAIAAYAEALAADPEGARVQAVEIYNLGRASVDCLDVYADDIKRMLDPGFRLHPEVPRPFADAIAGAIMEVVHDHAMRRRVGELPAISAELAWIALAPFVGASAAAEVAGASAAAEVAGARSAADGRRGREAGGEPSRATAGSPSRA
jgi:AcrR family transcriptional regulator